MNEKDTREIIRLYYRNEFDGEYEISRTADTCSEFGFDTISVFAQTINLFLRHIGYPSFDKDTVFLESVTEDEYEMLHDYLQDMRGE